MALGSGCAVRCQTCRYALPLRFSLSTAAGLAVPSVAATGHAFESLHALQYLTEPSDSGQLTHEGVVAAQLGVDLTLTKLVLYCVRLGVASEGAALAAALSQQQSPFQRTSPYVHSAAESYDILRRTLHNQEAFDAGLCAAPLMMLRVV